MECAGLSALWHIGERLTAHHTETVTANYYPNQYNLQIYHGVAVLLSVQGLLADLIAKTPPPQRSADPCAQVDQTSGL